MSIARQKIFGRRAYDKAIPVALTIQCLMLMLLWVANMYWLSLVTQRAERMSRQIGAFDRFMKALNIEDSEEPKTQNIRGNF